jgi:uncharacterized membrane protein (DUF106 family)
MFIVAILPCVVIILITAAISILLVIALMIYSEKDIKKMNEAQKRHMAEIDRTIKAIHDKYYINRLP